MQRKFHLGNHLLNLPNGTAIKYRQLKIPCCRVCNNEHLSSIEKKMKQAVESGVDAVRALDPLVLFLWLGKVFYGLLYRDFLLLRDRRDPQRGPILPREVLAHFAMHKFFLQAARRPFEFKPDIPASIFVFKTKPPKSIRAQAAFNDVLPTMTISVRLGEVGILAALQDGGAQRTMSQALKKYQSVALHPIQFANLTAMFFYKAHLATRVPKFMSFQQDGKIIVMQSPLAGLSSKPLFDKWDWTAYAHVLAHYTDFQVEQLLRPEGVWTWLEDGTGAVPDITFETFPFE